MGRYAEHVLRGGRDLSMFTRAKRVSNCYIPQKNMCASVRLCVCSTNLGISGVVKTLLLCRMYLVSAGRNLYVRTLCSTSIATSLKKKICVRMCVCSTNLGISGVVKRYCCVVCTWYQPTEIYTYVRYVPHHMRSIAW